MGSGDLANAFYTLGVPDELARMFTLPAVKAEKLGITTIDGCAVRPGDLVTPLPHCAANGLGLGSTPLSMRIDESNS